MCGVLLVLGLISRVCAGTFEVNVTRTAYQAQENGDITLEWTFTAKPERTLVPLYVYCQLLTDHRAAGVYHLHDGAELPESQDGQFAGRVRCDRDVLREGRLRLHVSRLRTEDSGTYLCEVLTNYGGNFSRCHLSVSASVRPDDEGQTQRNQGTTVGLCTLVCAALLLLWVL